MLVGLTIKQMLNNYLGNDNYKMASSVLGEKNPLDTINCNCGLLAGTHSHILGIIICLLYHHNKSQICYSPAVICNKSRAI